MAGVFRHNGQACVPASAGNGRDVRCGDARTVQRGSAEWPTRAALALKHNRDEIFRTQPAMRGAWDASSRSLRFSAPALAKVEIGRNDWAAPEPVTGHHQ
jgi:hypothetical protein